MDWLLILAILAPGPGGAAPDPGAPEAAILDERVVGQMASREMCILAGRGMAMLMASAMPGTPVRWRCQQAVSA